MAEAIELRREEAIREYEAMKYLKLFTNSEISSIKTKRLHHDYRVERRKKNLSDFINYITYEVNLFHLLVARRKKLRIEKAGWESLEKSIHKRVRILYKRAMTRFASEYRIWTHFMQYCQMRHFYVEGSRALSSMLGYHGDKPKAWLSAINWEYQLANNPASAKHYNLRGLQRHPESRELCLSLIGMEFAEAKGIADQLKKSKRNDPEQTDASLTKALKMAQLVYRNFVCKDVEFFQQLFEELKKYSPLSDELGKEAVETMQTSLTETEEMWDLLANLTLEGSKYVELDEGKDQLAICTEIYQKGIAQLPTKKMYRLYIDALLKLNDSEVDTVKEAKARRRALADAFSEALSVDMLDEEKMDQYLKLLLHNPNPKDELVLTVIGKATEQYPNSAVIWAHYLGYLIQKQAEPEQVEGIFSQATASLTNDASRITLWKIMFQYYHSRSNDSSAVEAMYRKAIAERPDIANHFQPLFLDFLISTSGIVSARQEYRRMVSNATTSLELHRKMASLEAKQDPKNIREWRLCHEHATQRFGKLNPSVWLEYIQFERDHGRAALMQALYDRAKASLDDDAFASFLPEYEHLKNPSL